MESKIGFQVGLVAIIISLILSFTFSERHVFIAFFIAAVFVPVFFTIAAEMFNVFVKHEKFEPKNIYLLSYIFVLPGIPIYLILALPFYYGLKIIDFPIIISFPLAVNIIVISILKLLGRKSWSNIEWLYITACNVLHAWFILWLITWLKP